MSRKSGRLAVLGNLTAVRNVEQETQQSQRDRAAGWGLEAMFDVHLRLIGKRVVDFLLAVIEPFLLGVTVEVLPATVDWNLAFFKRVG